jgi:hypothetical protein
LIGRFGAIPFHETKNSKIHRQDWVPLDTRIVARSQSLSLTSSARQPSAIATTTRHDTTRHTTISYD